MQVTDTVVLAVTAVVTSDVPGVEGNVKAAALMVHDAVMVICTVKLAVAVPACAPDGAMKQPVIRAAMTMLNQGGGRSISRTPNVSVNRHVQASFRTEQQQS